MDRVAPGTMVSYTPTGYAAPAARQSIAFGSSATRGTSEEQQLVSRAPAPGYYQLDQDSNWALKSGLPDPAFRSGTARFNKKLSLAPGPGQYRNSDQASSKARRAPAAGAWVRAPSRARSVTPSMGSYHTPAAFEASGGKMCVDSKPAIEICVIPVTGLALTARESPASGLEEHTQVMSPVAICAGANAAVQRCHAGVMSCNFSRRRKFVGRQTKGQRYRSQCPKDSEAEEDAQRRDGEEKAAPLQQEHADDQLLLDHSLLWVGSAEPPAIRRKKLRCPVKPPQPMSAFTSGTNRATPVSGGDVPGPGSYRECEGMSISSPGRGRSKSAFGGTDMRYRGAPSSTGPDLGPGSYWLRPDSPGESCPDSPSRPASRAEPPSFAHGAARFSREGVFGQRDSGTPGPGNYEQDVAIAAEAQRAKARAILTAYTSSSPGVPVGFGARTERFDQTQADTPETYASVTNGLSGGGRELVGSPGVSALLSKRRQPSAAVQALLEQRARSATPTSGRRLTEEAGVRNVRKQAVGEGFMMTTRRFEAGSDAGTPGPGYYNPATVDAPTQVSYDFGNRLPRDGSPSTPFPEHTGFTPDAANLHLMPEHLW